MPARINTIPVIALLMTLLTINVAVAQEKPEVSPAGETSSDEASSDEASSGDWRTSDKGQELLERAEEVVEITEKFRGLGTRKPVKKGLMLKDELRVILLEKLAEENEEQQLDSEAKLLKRLGLLDPDLDYEEFIVELLTEQIAGFYDDETGELYILEGQDEAYLDTVFSHELFHAIQDQHFGIGRIRAGGDDNADLLAARIALVEGDAVGVMVDFDLYPDMSFTDVPGFEAMMRSSTSMAGVASDMMDKAPLVLRESLIFPYVDGLLFVGEIKRRGGWKAVNEIYDDPPMSTEQVIHPEKYLERDDPVAVHFTLPPSLKDATKVLYDDVSGELGHYLFLKQHLVELDGDKAQAAPATTGWDGDRTLLLEDDKGRLSYLMLSVWDTEQDATEFYDSMKEVAQLRYPTAETQAMEGTTGKSALMDLGNELLWLEKRGNDVLYLEGIPDGDAGRERVDRLRDTIWLTREVRPYPSYEESVKAFEAEQADKKGTDQADSKDTQQADPKD